MRKIDAESEAAAMERRGGINTIAIGAPPLLHGTDLVNWRTKLNELAPLGASALMDYTEASSLCLTKFGAACAIRLAETCLHVDELTDNEAARMVLRTAQVAVRSAPSAAVYEQYLDLLVTVARQRPSVLPELLKIQAKLLPSLDARRLKHWVGAGLAIPDWTGDGGRGYFRLEAEEAKRLFSQMTSNVSFDGVAACIRAYLKALWALDPILAVAKSEDMLTPARTSFAGSLVRVPQIYPGLDNEDAARQFRGAMAHVAAHMVYGSGRAPVGKLKPVQIALISLIEDARVENLAAVELPGLARLWAGFHTALPTPALTVDKLLARLARALADPAYKDGNPWVEKGRQLFFEQKDRWLEEDFSRRLGGALGHDLGQMRIPFNPKAYIVQPSYRDDNTGLWDGEPDELSDKASEAEAIIDRTAPPPKSHDQDNTERKEALRVCLSEQDGILVARYPEWDFQTATLLREWTAVHSHHPKPASVEAVRTLMAGADKTVGRLESLLKSARTGRPKRLNAQAQGDTLDLEACIRQTIERRAGHFANDRHHQTKVIAGRSLSIFVLLDISHSTRDRIGNTSDTIIGMERRAVAVLGSAIERVGDPFAIAGFCSDGRNDVRFYEVKAFNQVFDEACHRRLAGLRGMLSTRLGAALRHAGAQVAQQHSARRLVLVVTDGEPSDVDVPENRYLLEDARHAVHELNHDGIDVFAVALGEEGRASLPRIFARRGFMTIDSIEQLPVRLTKLYYRFAS